MPPNFPPVQFQNSPSPGDDVYITETGETGLIVEVYGYQGTGVFECAVTFSGVEKLQNVIYDDANSRWQAQIFEPVRLPDKDGVCKKL